MESMESSDSTVASLLTSTLPHELSERSGKYCEHLCELLATIEDFSLFSASRRHSTTVKCSFDFHHVVSYTENGGLDYN